MFEIVVFTMIFCYNLFVREFGILKSLLNACLWVVLIWCGMFLFFFGLTAFLVLFANIATSIH